MERDCTLHGPHDAPPWTYAAWCEAEDLAYDQMTTLSAMLHRRPHNAALRREYERAHRAYLALSETRERMETDR